MAWACAKIDCALASACSFVLFSFWFGILEPSQPITIWLNFVFAPALSGGTADYGSAAAALAKSKQVADFELNLYTKTGLGDGQQAGNPWLQEFPDPITRVSWDNYITVSATDAKKLDFINEIVANGGLNGSVANLEVNGVKLENVPVIVQPGQAVGTIGLALGYGRKAALKEEMQVGLNAYSLYNNFNTIQSVKVTKANPIVPTAWPGWTITGTFSNLTDRKSVV